MQFRYAMVYVLITSVVLLFLNIYTSGTSQKLFYQNKHTSMVEKCQLTASEIATMEVLITLNIREMQMKTIVRYHLTPVKMAIIKKSTNNKC